MVKIHKKVGHIVAREVSLSRVMDEAAKKVQRELQAEAARHRDTGDFERSIKITTRDFLSKEGIVVKNRYVYSTDPGAIAIEYGHTARSKKHNTEHEVPGKHIFTNYLNRMK